MYSDLASLFERAGRINGRRGSLTQIPILSMPDDDVSHPIPDVTGYITEGQIVLSRELDRRGIDPPIDIPSLSRLMNAGIGDGSTRGDHRGVADEISAFLGRGHELRRLISVVGEQALSDDDRRILAFRRRARAALRRPGHATTLDRGDGAFAGKVSNSRSPNTTAKRTQNARPPNTPPRPARARSSSMTSMAVCRAWPEIGHFD